MLRILAPLHGYVIKATDGEIGFVHEFLFDNDTWAIRYMVVKTGSWLTGRKVLITPGAIGYPEWSSKSISVELTMEQVKNSPDIDADKPVSLQQLDLLHEYYGWPYVLAGGFAPLPLVPFPATLGKVERDSSAKQRDDLHLFRAKDQ